ncbi:calcium-binding protein [Cellulomonas sp. SG140]|uniref:calcium-binding protein n=1 Tax=Cellulomonas sp. SG140 TaxID=2976536 RepID=UPI0021E9221B|nr:calcium-binding protein [Cellulomonas sp. SG140]
MEIKLGTRLVTKNARGKVRTVRVLGIDPEFRGEKWYLVENEATKRTYHISASGLTAKYEVVGE